MKMGLTFDDVLLVPQQSFHDPTQVDTSVSLSSRIRLKIPILSAAMDTVTESNLAIILGRQGGVGMIHKNNTAEEQAEEVRKVKKAGQICGAAISVGCEALDRARFLVNAGVDILVVDVAHGHFYKVAETVKRLRDQYQDRILIIGGNVATASATHDLIQAGAHVIKVGVGPGSICTTRVIAGIGVPQLTAIMEAVKVADIKKIPVIADGGIKFSGDVVKALAAGACSVMIGSLFAGTEESPGRKVRMNDRQYKVYRGMGSIGALIEGGKDRYMQSKKTEEREMIAEGVEGLVPYKGEVKEVVCQLVGGLRQGLGYCGAKNINELKEKAKFIRITSSGLKESHPHNLYKIQDAPNYQGSFL